MPASLPAAAVQQFVVDGLHVVPPDELSLDLAFHRAVVAQTDAVVVAGDELGGNRLLLRVPLLRELLHDPAVDGALCSLFGEGWQLFQHSAMHDGGRQQDPAEQVLHKDGPMFGQPRYHRPRWGLLLYYPQAVDDEMGPTKVLPGSQYLFQHFGNPDPSVALPQPHRLTTRRAGTVVITHYELFHGATGHLSNRNRQMHKLIIVRTEEPTAMLADPTATVPFWEAADFRPKLSKSTEAMAPLGSKDTASDWRNVDDAALARTVTRVTLEAHLAVDRPLMLPLRSIWSTVWRWYNGGAHIVAQSVSETESCTSECTTLMDVLRDPTCSTWSVATQREAADQLALDAVLGRIRAHHRREVAQVLATSALEHDDELVRLSCSYGLGALGEISLLLANLETEGRRRLGPDPNDRNGRSYDGSPASAFTNPSQLDAVFGLAAAVVATGASSAYARSVLVAKLQDPGATWWVQAGTAWALAEIGWSADGHTEAVLEALAAATKDDNEWVARNAAESIGTAIGGQPHMLVAAGAASERTVHATAAVLARCVRSDRLVSPWSLSPEPLQEIAAASLARMQRATTTLVQPVVDELIQSYVGRGTGSGTMQSDSERSGFETSTSEYVRYWLLRLGGSSRFAVAAPSL